MPRLGVGCAIPWPFRAHVLVNQSRPSEKSQNVPMPQPPPVAATVFSHLTSESVAIPIL